jgi:hypothetical protein
VEIIADEEEQVDLVFGYVIRYLLPHPGVGGPPYISSLLPAPRDIFVPQGTLLPTLNYGKGWGSPCMPNTDYLQ